MYSVFKSLCDQKGVTPSEVARATGIAQTTLSNWKIRNNYLNTKAAQKIADYFGVSLQYLMTGEGASNIIQHPTNDYVVSENDDLKLLIETVKDAPSDVLVRLRYYAEGLLAARREQ